jgi:hypothetical protein
MSIKAKKNCSFGCEGIPSSTHHLDFFVGEA